MKKMKSHTEKSVQLPPKQTNKPQLAEFQWVCELAKQFQDQIQKRLQIRQAFVQKAESQKCLNHNITYSIYCTICRKSLCASCMYNSSQHRKHRVIPIQNATEELNEDIRTFQSKIMKVGNQVQSLIESNSEILMRIEKQYSPLVTRLKEFYQNLRTLIKKKERQQLQVLKEIKESTTAQISHYNRQLSRMNDIIMSKMRQCVKEDYKYKQPLAPRSVLQTLIQASNFINQTLLDGDKFKFPSDIGKISSLQTEIEMKIEAMFNTFQVQMRSPRSCQIQKLKIKSTGKKVSFTQTRLKLQQNKKSDRQGRKDNRSMSNIAGRSQFHRI